MPPYVDSEKNAAVPAKPPWNPQLAGHLAGLPEQHQLADDGYLAAMYIRMWSLASGRRLRDDVPPEQLSEDELIAFWADDLGPPSGRHATGTPAKIRRPA
jgi:hypothetical protein